MTQDEIMEMARRAHFDSKTWVDIFADNPTVGDVRNYLIAFAKLVAAKAIAELESQERNFCPRCGKRTNDIHTCTPPQSTWVGLTDEEIEDIVEDCDGVGWDVAQAIRAKLKEKNT
jgi:hypothetical protein